MEARRGDRVLRQANGTEDLDESQDQSFIDTEVTQKTHMSMFARYTDYNGTPYISVNAIKLREEQRANQNTDEERGKELVEIVEWAWFSPSLIAP